MIFLMFLLVASTTPFIFCRYGDELSFLILNCVQSLVIILLYKFVPLSMMILSGMPYRQMRLCLINRATTFLVTEANEAASTHFVKYSIATRIKRCSLEAVGLISPIISIPHIAKGQGAVRTFNGTGGTCTLSAYIWHL